MKGLILAVLLAASGATAAGQLTIKGITLGEHLPSDVKTAMAKNGGFYKTTYMGLPVQGIVLADKGGRVFNVSFNVSSEAVSSLEMQLTKKYGTPDRSVADAPEWVIGDCKVLLSYGGPSSGRPMLQFLYEGPLVKLDPNDT